MLSVIFHQNPPRSHWNDVAVLSTLPRGIFWPWPVLLFLVLQHRRPEKTSGTVPKQDGNEHILRSHRSSLPPPNKFFENQNLFFCLEPYLQHRRRCYFFPIATGERVWTRLPSKSSFLEACLRDDPSGPAGLNVVLSSPNTHRQWSPENEGKISCKKERKDAFLEPLQQHGGRVLVSGWRWYREKPSRAPDSVITTECAGFLQSRLRGPVDGYPSVTNCNYLKTSLVFFFSSLFFFPSLHLALSHS